MDGACGEVKDTGGAGGRGVSVGEGATGTFDAGRNYECGDPIAISSHVHFFDSRVETKVQKIEIFFNVIF